MRGLAWRALMNTAELLRCAEILVGEAAEYAETWRRKFDAHAPGRWQWYVEVFGE